MSFLPIGAGDQLVSAETVVRPAWLGDRPKLTSFYTDLANQNPQGLNVYAESPGANPGTPVQFSIAYGHMAGSGSVGLQGDVPTSRIVYGSLRSLLYNNESGSFSFGAGDNAPAYTSPDVLVIAVGRSCAREAIHPGSLDLVLNGTGSTQLRLTDASGHSSRPLYAGDHRYYPIISGSAGQLATGATVIGTVSGSYGMLVPDLGLIVLNPRALALPPVSKGAGLSFLSAGASLVNNNAVRLYDAIRLGSFGLRSQETVTSKNLFLRVPHDQCNYTTNPTAIDPVGNLLNPTMVDNPETFITTIGLMNPRGQILATVKISQPQKKSSTEEVYFKVKLAW